MGQFQQGQRKEKVQEEMLKGIGLQIQLAIHRIKGYISGGNFPCYSSVPKYTYFTFCLNLMYNICT